MKKIGVKKKNWWIDLATNDLSDLTGFILREFDYKETSKILEVFTKEEGRISVIVKGAFKKKTKSTTISQRFAKVNLNLYKSGKEFYGAKEISLVNAYSKSNKNFDLILYKSAICDLLLRTIDHSQADLVYKLLDNTFQAFEEADENQINIFLAFLIKYISFSGFKPNLSTCGLCGKKIKDTEIYFSQSQSSLICTDDKYDIYDIIFLSKEEFIYLKKLLYTASSDLYKINKPTNYNKIVIIIIDYILDKLEISRFSSIDWVYKNSNERN